MRTWTIDTEADDLLEGATKIHCAVLKNLTTGVVQKFVPSTIDYLPRFLEEEVDLLIGHNIIKYDLPLIKKVLNYDYTGRVYDTLVLSRWLSPIRPIPRNCLNRRASQHGLEAWGYRVGRGKPEHHDWSDFSMAMLHRCSEDVEINELVYYVLKVEMKDGDWSKAVPMTMKLFQTFNDIENYGWKVDQEHMANCIEELDQMMEDIDRTLAPILPYVRENQGEVKKPFKKNGEYSHNVLKWIDKTSDSSYEALMRGYLQEVGGPFTRLNYRKLDLNSRNEVVDYLLDSGWEPTEWNFKKDTKERSSPKLSITDPFEGIEGEAGELAARRVQVRHRKSLIEGLQKLVRPDGRISSRISGLAETGRVKHAGIVNIPNVDAFYGKEIRRIFTHGEDRVLVGVDSSGNQVRQLTSLMGDDEYEYAVVHGKQEDGTDVHTRNQEAAGLPTRSNAKTFFYGFLFGAGDTKIGKIVNGTGADGRRLKERFFQSLPKLKELIDRVTDEWRVNAKWRWQRTPWGSKEKYYYNGWVEGLDGRPVYIKSEHAILVYILQNMEAIQMSYALLFANKWLQDKGLKWGEDYGIVCFYHDEINTECKPEFKEVVGETVKKAIIYAGEHLDIKTPHDGDIKYGESWYEIH